MEMLKTYEQFVQANTSHSNEMTEQEKLQQEEKELREKEKLQNEIKDIEASVEIEKDNKLPVSHGCSVGE